MTGLLGRSMYWSGLVVAKLVGRGRGGLISRRDASGKQGEWCIIRVNGGGL